MPVHATGAALVQRIYTVLVERSASARGFLRIPHDTGFNRIGAIGIKFAVGLFSGLAKTCYT